MTFPSPVKKSLLVDAQQGAPRISKNGRCPTLSSSLRNRSRPNLRPSRRNRRNRSLCSHSRDIRRHRHNHDIHRLRHNHGIHRSRSRAPPA
jgi:hypothetical protein